MKAEALDTTAAVRSSLLRVGNRTISLSLRLKELVECTPLLKAHVLKEEEVSILWSAILDLFEQNEAVARHYAFRAMLTVIEFQVSWADFSV